MNLTNLRFHKDKHVSALVFKSIWALTEVAEKIKDVRLNYLQQIDQDNKPVLQRESYRTPFCISVYYLLSL